MRKAFLKFINKLLKKPAVKFGAYVLGILAVFSFYGVFDNWATTLDKIRIIVSAQETVSVFFAGIFSIGLAKLIKHCDVCLEESLKIDDDHHKIIRKYSAHAKKDIDTNENFVDAQGVFMSLRHIGANSKKELKNSEKDKYSKTYKIVEKEIENFKNGVLYLPSLNIYTNVQGNTKVVFDDKNELYELPEYVMENASNLLAAHKNSTTSNNNTIRLSNFAYADNTLTLNTQRSTYYHMLMTNRCMDYDFSDGLTIRGIYEYSKQISPFDESQLGNQIGINGLILSKDGYVLIEKRGRRKTTWKNKFAQSISLAMKEDEMKLDANQVIGNTYEDANANLKNIIIKTINSNFGLTETDLDAFVLEKNFLGLARDLLEGGKPNMYFYVITKYTAAELAQKLEVCAGKTDDAALQTEKLTSDYYLIPFADIQISYHYTLKINRKKCYKIQRRVRPRSGRLVCFWDRTKYKIAKTVNPVLVRECGEALLVTLSYLELCQARIGEIQDK